MALSRRTGRSRLTLALLVLTSIAVLTLDFRDAGPIESARRVAASVFSPLRGAADTVSSPFTDAWNGVTRYGDVEAENEALRARLDELEGREVLNEDAAEQLEELLSQLDISWIGDIPTAAARVVAGSPSNFSHTIEIDKGADAGIAEGMPVTTGAGLVGRVVQVTSGSATVQLITDPDFAVGVRTVPAGDPGTARGQGRGGNLIVDSSIPAEETVRRGTSLTTAGTDLFPASIPVGKVTTTEEAGGGLTLDLIVRPMVDTDKLSFVTVMLWEPEL